MATKMKSSIIRDILEITQKPGVISFAGGLPAPDLFPIDDIKQACQKVLDEQGEKALQYGQTGGYYPLREQIAKWMKKFNINVTPDEIVITGGSQQGLDLTGRVFLNEGDRVITTNPTYLGAIQAFNAYNPEYYTVSSDEGGMEVDQLEDLIIEATPALIYLVPTFQNPDGRTLSLERRKTIVDLSRRYNIPIIEDDPYSELFFDREVPPHIKSLIPDNVVLLGTFSKLLAPGLRIAWLIAPSEVRDKYVKLKQGADLFTSRFTQFVITEILKSGKLDDHIKKLRKVYKEKRDCMIEAMKEYFPENVRWVKPEGGLFLWLILPEAINATELLPKAVEHEVAYIPGSAFFATGGGHNTIRLNFSYSSLEQTRKGMKRLGDLFKAELKKDKVIT